MDTIQTLTWLAQEAVFVADLCKHTFAQMPLPFQIPRDYTVFDLETTGFSREYDLIWNVGWAIVRDGVLVNSEDLTLNWADDVETDQDWLYSRIRKQQVQMRTAGRVCQLDYEKLKHGVPPLEGLSVLLRLLQDAIGNNEYIVGHGVCRFDCPMLDSHVYRFFPDDPPLTWVTDRIIDTGLIEKASQLGAFPRSDETLTQWYGRVSAANSKAKWALEPHCVEKYNLLKRFNLKSQHAHGGGFDCILTYTLLETFRQIHENTNG